MQLSGCFAIFASSCFGVADQQKHAYSSEVVVVFFFQVFAQMDAFKLFAVTAISFFHSRGFLLFPKPKTMKFRPKAKGSCRKPRDANNELTLTQPL